MGTIIEFPADAASRRREVAAGAGPATVLILPSVRIERHVDVASEPEPQQQGASGRRRKRRRAQP